MPVLSDSHHPGASKGHPATTHSLTSHNIYILISFTLLITLGFRLRQQRRQASTSDDSSTSPAHKPIFSSAQTMQTPPSSSALPEKPFLPDLESASYDVGHENPSLNLLETSVDSDTIHSTTSLPDQRESQLSFNDAAIHASSDVDAAARRSVSIQLSRPRRPGSLIHPEPPAPTISMKEPSMQIQTHLPYKPAKEYHFEDLQPEYQAQYIHNEILFVPSPTEYTSFEALYNKFPPPIYHEPNPTSYTSISASEFSDSGSRSYSTASFSGTDASMDHQDNTELPRRRSYTKTLSNGSEISGEIMISSGKGEGEASRQWRRHTRVFGGGICMACEESESRNVGA